MQRIAKILEVKLAFVQELGWDELTASRRSTLDLDETVHTLSKCVEKICFKSPILKSSRADGCPGSVRER